MKNEVLPPICPTAEPDVTCAAVDCDDKSWREVLVPHDRGLDAGFDYDRSSSDGCVEPGRFGWYRRELEVPAAAEGKRVFFECDGAMSFAMVWINGHFVGGWPYGYTPWRVELTPHVVFGGRNVLAVRTAFVSGASRFYTGAGLQRDCHLVFCDDDHLVPDSVAIRTDSVSSRAARVTVSYAMSRSGPRQRTFTVENPRCWDVDDPYLYSVDVEGETFRYGIRTFAFYPDERRPPGFGDGGPDGNRDQGRLVQGQASSSPAGRDVALALSGGRCDPDLPVDFSEHAAVVDDIVKLQFLAHLP